MRPLSFIILLAVLATSFCQAQPKQKEEAQTAPKVFSYVEQMPEFKGEVQKYIVSNVRYPDSARVHDIQGRVFVKFIVNEDGSLSGFEIPRPLHPLLDEEALRVVRSMPPWNPGKQNGKAVKVSYMLPIVFMLD
jgi:protein TonB